MFVLSRLTEVSVRFYRLELKVMQYTGTDEPFFYISLFIYHIENRYGYSFFYLLEYI